MPIYEYQCDSCNEVFEEWCKQMDDTSVKPCPACGKDAQRVISRTSFALKGGGWYATDYGVMKGKGEPMAATSAAAKPADTAAPAAPSTTTAPAASSSPS